MTIKTVACIGVGNVGRAWAIAFARGGCRTRLYDAQPGSVERSLEQMEANLVDLQSAGLIEDRQELKDHLIVCDSLEAAVDGADYVQESIKEDLTLKKEIFATLDHTASVDTILASSTSEFMSSQFAMVANAPERCLVAHPFNPPYLIPLVELSGHSMTSADTIDRARAFLEEIGMSPVVVQKEIKAFLLNRLQAAVVSEALFLVGEGYCTATDLDRAMTDGLGLRWAFMGPFMTGHLNASGGYSEYMRNYGDTFRRMIDDLNPDYKWSLDLVDSIHAEMTDTVATDRVADGQAWRDRRLMAALNVRRAAEQFD
ncbi:MAG: 3-hydroxyacyl-CoA dehydrogenase [Pseudomonadota bacterium]